MFESVTILAPKLEICSIGKKQRNKNEKNVLQKH